jgi:hypothetical protein
MMLKERRSMLLQADDNAGNRTISFSGRQVQRKFRHAADFGITGTYNPANAARFEQALRAHVEDRATLMIEGTYRGEQVTHFVHPHTGVNVIRGATGAFISGWRLNPAQLQNLFSRGTL